MASIIDETYATIGTAPRDGTLIIVADEEVGAFPMRWNYKAENDFFAPGITGMWETPDKSMTWTEHDGFGPRYWKPLDARGAN